MSSDALDLVADVPNFADLKPLTKVAQELNFDLGTVYRWRTDRKVPLACWRVGGEWRTTDEAVRDFIRRKTIAANADKESTPASAPMHTARRRKQIDQAVEKAKAMGC